tara:strand:+ start:143 stop:385 length:243 start_codon:yes stop_codon:yes gene_type:complete
MARILIDTTEVYGTLNKIKDYVESRSIEEIPKAFLDEIFKLSEGLGLKGSICVLPPTTVAGDHVIRLGVRGILKVLAATI